MGAGKRPILGLRWPGKTNAAATAIASGAQTDVLEGTAESYSATPSTASACAAWAHAIRRASFRLEGRCDRGPVTVAEVEAEAAKILAEEGAR